MPSPVRRQHFGLPDRVRAELLRRIGLGDLLNPRVLTTKSQNAALALLAPKLREDARRWLQFTFRRWFERSSRTR
jgi:hypothetical protein